MDKKKCPKCKKTLPVSMYSREKSGKLFGYCISCHREWALKYYHDNHEKCRERNKKYCKENSARLQELNKKRKLENKKLFVDYKGGKCSVCGYKKCISALEFHHLNSNEKNKNIMKHIPAQTFQRAKPELDKCILLCANCHREMHHHAEMMQGVRKFQ